MLIQLEIIPPLALEVINVENEIETTATLNAAPVFRGSSLDDETNNVFGHIDILAVKESET